MTYQATVYRVLIASPNDVIPERKAISDTLHSWNALNSQTMGIVLLPIMWETHSAPEMGSRPQEIINKQLVRDCDILIGAFWTRIGTHTGVAESGTVEEIDEFLKVGKQVMLYFSTAPVLPDSIDPSQYKKLVDFRNVCEKKGLIERYESVGDFREKLSRHITIRVRKIHGSDVGGDSESSIISAPRDASIGAMLMDQLLNSIRQHKVDWDTERNSEPVNVEDGKLIIQELTKSLVEYRAALSDKLDKSILNGIDKAITNLKILQRHELYMDGGASYKAFWTKGDEQFNTLEAIRDSAGSSMLTGDPSRLDSGCEKILVVLGKYEEQGGKYLPADELAQALNISVVRVQHMLDELVKTEYVHDLLTANMPTKYMFAPKGRKYLVDTKLI